MTDRSSPPSTPPRRVVLGTSNFPPEFLGGTERVVLAVARALRAAGDEVLILTGSELPKGDEDVVVEEFDGFPIRRIPRLPEEVYSLWIERPRVRALCSKVLSDFGAEVLHLHHWVTLSTELIRAADDAGVPTVLTLHDMWTTCARFFRRPPLGVTCPEGSGRAACTDCVHRALGYLARDVIEDGIRHRDHHLGAEIARAAILTTPSQSAADKIRIHLPTERQPVVVPHGLLDPVSTVRSGAEQQRSLSGPLRIGTFGNLVEEKGVLLLIWACRGLPEVELHYFGPFLAEDCRTEALARAEEFGVDLHTHGAYAPDEHHPALDLDLAVFPSLCEETYGLVVDEALARGTPVVVSDRGALSERVGGGGLVSSVDDVESLQATLRSVVEDRTRLAELLAGIPKNFSTIADAAAEYRNLYERACMERSS